MGRIVVHISVWGVLFLLLITSDWDWQGYSTEDGTFYLPLSYGFVFNAAIFYLNALWLFPRMWKLRRSKYWLLTGSMLIVASAVEGGLDVWYSMQVGTFDAMLEASDVSKLLPNQAVGAVFISHFVANLVVHLLFWALSFSYLLPKEKVKNIRLENAQLHAELKYLKAQIDPHTLFNGINGIYHLIDQDPERAKQYLHGFANIMRYQIYDGNEELIPLQNECLFLHRFFELNQLRRSDDAQIEWDIPQYSGALHIAPVVLLPFVENAFKYLSNHELPEHNYIKASIRLENNTLYFCLKNSFDAAIEVQQGKVGLVNVQHRLQLIYPSRHTLQMDTNNQCYTVNLTLELDEKA